MSGIHVGSDIYGKMKPRHDSVFLNTKRDRSLKRFGD